MGTENQALAALTIRERDLNVAQAGFAAAVALGNHRREKHSEQED
jgi:hypothetical protein